MFPYTPAYGLLSSQGQPGVGTGNLNIPRVYRGIPNVQVLADMLGLDTNHVNLQSQSSYGELLRHMGSENKQKSQTYLRQILILEQYIHKPRRRMQGLTLLTIIMITLPYKLLRRPSYAYSSHRLIWWELF